MNSQKLTVVHGYIVAISGYKPLASKVHKGTLTVDR